MLAFALLAAAQTGPTPFFEVGVVRAQNGTDQEIRVTATMMAAAMAACFTKERPLALAALLRSDGVVSFESLTVSDMVDASEEACAAGAMKAAAPKGTFLFLAAFWKRSDAIFETYPAEVRFMASAGKVREAEKLKAAKVWEAEKRKEEERRSAAEAVAQAERKAIAACPPWPPKTSKGIRLPYGLLPTTTRADLDYCVHACQVDDADGSARCNLANGDGALTVTVGGLEVPNVFVTFTSSAMDARIASVVMMTTGLDSCDRMGAAVAAARGLIDKTYKSPSDRVARGKHFGTSACKHYMAEGNVFYRVENDVWSVATDSFFQSGEYAVFLTIKNNKADRERVKEGRRRAALKAAEGMKKL